MWQEWQQAPLLTTPSRSQPSGGRWKTAVIPVPTGSEGCGMEFVIKSSFGQVCHLCSLHSFLQQYTSLLHHIQAANFMTGWYHNLAANITSILLSTKFSVVHVTFAKSVFCIIMLAHLYACRSDMPTPVESSLHVGTCLAQYLCHSFVPCRWTGHMEAAPMCALTLGATRFRMGNCAPFPKPTPAPSCWSVQHCWISYCSLLCFVPFTSVAGSDTH